MRVRPGFDIRELLSAFPHPRAYKYQPLPPTKSLRLLEVHRSSDKIIRCSLKTFPIEGAPPFDALSYTWGYPLIPESKPSRAVTWRRLAHFQRLAAKAQKTLGGDYSDAALANITENTPCFPVRCDNKTILVTGNLYEFLSLLATKRTARLSDQQYVWADALCINQANFDERNQQVNLIAEIFKAAQNVLIWLGDEDQFTTDAFTVIERISSIDRAKWDSFPYTGFYGDPECYKEAGIEPPTYYNWLGFIAFINRPWFKRAWVVQELALARSGTMIRGRRLLPWEQLSTTIKFIRHVKWYHHLQTEKMRHLPELERNPGAYGSFLQSKSSFSLEPIYLDSTRKTIQSGKGSSMRHLVDTHRATQATDDRDKIYAFLSLADKRTKLFATNSVSMEPDYQKPIQQVYTQAAGALLSSYGNLYLLSHVQDSSRTKVQGLPSWVPDYSVSLQPYPLEFRGKCNWRACGKHKWNGADYQSVAQTGLLPVQGFHLDIVAETAVMRHETSDAGKPWASIVDLVLNSPNPYEFRKSDGSHISRVEALWRTLTTNTYSRKHPAPAQCRDLFIDYILNLQIRYRLNLGSSNETHFQPHLAPISSLTHPAWEDLFAAEPADSEYNLAFYHERMTWMVKNLLSKNASSPIALAQLHHDIEYGSGKFRRLFRTKELHFLGTGPQSLEQDDEVWVLAGGKVPFILRRVQDQDGNTRHRLVGEAYVHGIMHGDPSRWGKDLQDILLE